MKKYFLFIFFVLFFINSLSAQPDLKNKDLKGIELDFISTSPSNKNVYVYSDLTYWNFFGVRLHGWNGGNLSSSTFLPDGNTFWAFGDSYFGVISENRNRKTYNQPRNAAMIQTGEASQEDFITLNSYISTSLKDLKNYYKGKTWLRHPDASLNEHWIKTGTIDRDFYFWPDDATIINVDGVPNLQVLLGGYDEKGNRFETSTARFSLAGKPGDKEYMKLVELKRNIVPYRVDYGSAILEDEGHIYLYGTVETGGLFGGRWAVVARTASLNLTSQWEYYIKDKSGEFFWKKTIPTLDEIKKSNISSGFWCESSSVFKYNGKYYMCCEESVNGDLYILMSDNPWGPFANRKKIFTFTEEKKNTSHVVVHPQLSRTGELVLSYNMNPAPITVISKGKNGSALETIKVGKDRNYNAWNSADLNQPHFLRIFNWQNLFGVDNVGPLKDAGVESYTAGIRNLIAEDGSKEIKMDYSQASSTLKIYCKGKFSWYVYSSSGVEIRRGKADQTTVLDLSALSAGVYIVKADRKNGMSKNLKIIKK